MDGTFMAHFGLEKQQTIHAILAAPDDDAVAQWFLSLPAVSDVSIATWNALAPNVGKEGYPMHRELRFMLHRIYQGSPPPVLPATVFEAIALDEGS
jgi:hypothetical protein